MFNRVCVFTFAFILRRDSRVVHTRVSLLCTRARVDVYGVCVRVSECACVCACVRASGRVRARACTSCMRPPRSSVLGIVFTPPTKRRGCPLVPLTDVDGNYCTLNLTYHRARARPRRGDTAYTYTYYTRKVR